MIKVLKLETISNICIFKMPSEGISHLSYITDSYEYNTKYMNKTIYLKICTKQKQETVQLKDFHFTTNFK